MRTILQSNEEILIAFRSMTPDQRADFLDLARTLNTGGDYESKMINMGKKIGREKEVEELIKSFN